MNAWIIQNDRRIMNDVAMLVMVEDDDNLKFLNRRDICNGSVMRLRRKLNLEPFKEKRQRKPDPRVDVSTFIPGALILNCKAYDAFMPFMKPFAQLIEIDVAGETEYLLNVTNIIDCINLKLTKRRPSGSILAVNMYAAKIPKEPVMFKAPETRRNDIYINESAKQMLERIIEERSITGLEFILVEAS